MSDLKIALTRTPTVDHLSHRLAFPDRKMLGPPRLSCHGTRNPSAPEACPPVVARGRCGTWTNCVAACLIPLTSYTRREDITGTWIALTHYP